MLHFETIPNRFQIPRFEKITPVENAPQNFPINFSNAIEEVQVKAPQKRKYKRPNSINENSVVSRSV